MKIDQITVLVKYRVTLNNINIPRPIATQLNNALIEGKTITWNDCEIRDEPTTEYGKAFDWIQKNIKEDNTVDLDIIIEELEVKEP